MDITVNCSKSQGEFEHFWQGTGFTPAKFLLDDDMRQQMIYVGSIPHGGVTHIRIHYLLDLIKVTNMQADEPIYNWKRLDKGLDLLIENGLKPFFELMGNPSLYFTDFNDAHQLHAWKRLVRDLAYHLMSRYGKEEVESWYFETWNEPDTSWWHQWPLDIQSFCNYYDACCMGLWEANPKLTMGGPGSCRTLSPLFKGFVAHCDTGTNYFTKEQGVRLDFISIHEKGRKSNLEDLPPDTKSICLRELLSYQYVVDNHPKLAKLPFINNECDVQTAWRQHHTWRAKPYYAANIVKIIEQHQRLIIDQTDCNYVFLSNDNGFLGDWGQRTHLTRFWEHPGVDNNKHPTRARPEEFEFIKKPGHNVMVMLSLLGDQRLEPQLPENDQIGVLATKRAEEQVAILLYNAVDAVDKSGVENIQLDLKGLPFNDVQLVRYLIDEDHTNPFKLWEEMDGPGRLSEEQLASLRDKQELKMVENKSTTADNGQIIVNFDLLLPGVILLLLNKKSEAKPDKVVDLRAENYLGTTTQDQVMLIWHGLESRFIKTYEILYANTAEGPFERVNKADQIQTAFLHTKDPVDQHGFYKVRAVDYWDRIGAESDVLRVAD